MAFTYQTIVDLARLPLNDSDKVRYSDEQLLMFANHGMLTVARFRPDLFVGQFTSLPNGENLLTDTFQIDPSYAQPVADYVTARAELVDDEHVNSGRASLLINLFRNELPA